MAGTPLSNPPEPTRRDLEIYAGAEFKTVYTFEDPTVDLTDYVADLVIRETLEGPALVTLSESGGITISVADRTVTVELTQAQTDALGVRAGVYDLFIDTDAGTPDRYELLYGQVDVYPAVTR